MYYLYLHKNIQEVIMLFNPTIAPGVSFADKRSTDEKVSGTYWDAKHLRDKIASERTLKWNPFTGEEILEAFCSPENRAKFPNLFAQQKSLFPALYKKLEDISLPPIEEEGTASAASAAPQQQQIQLEQLTGGEELDNFFRSSENQAQFPNLFSQHEAIVLEEAIALSFQVDQPVDPSGENSEDVDDAA